MKNKKGTVGRPKKYNEAEEMQEKIDNYFSSCFNIKVSKTGVVIYSPITGNPVMEQIRPFTIAGLANALDMSRQSLLNYSEDDKFSDIIKKAKRKCEVYTEERLFDKDGVKGAVFSLVNNYENWKDKQEVGGKIGIGTIENYIKEVESDNEY